MASFNKKNVRYNILSIIVYVIGIILIAKLFELQIVHGDEYLEQANSRLTRENRIKAARGKILDSNGNLLAGIQIKYSIKLYKSKIQEEELNKTILNTITVLERNNDEYKDNFPISINPIKYDYDNQEKISTWLRNNLLEEDLSAENTLNYYIEKYGLLDYSLEDARKIIAVRYGLEQNRLYKYARI